MTLSDFFYAIGDFMQMTFLLLEADMIGNLFNYFCLSLGFFGMFFWLYKQRKFNAAADKDANQLK